MSLYMCASCFQSISASNPRVRCFTCNKVVDLCANCQLGERFLAPHTGEHQVYILKISGTQERPSHPGIVPASVLGSIPKNILAEPPQIPTQPSAVTIVPSSFTPPARPQNKPPQKATVTAGLPLSNVPPSGGPKLSVLNGSSDTSLWKPFFNKQGLAGPAFIELLSAVFKRLDPTNTGALTPEAVSEFWSAMGQIGDANPWQHEIDMRGRSRKDLADQVLRNYYSILSIDHRMGQRSVPDRHVGITCDSCKAQNFIGGRYKCTHEKCPGYDLCETCHSKAKGTHPADHQFQLVSLPQGNPTPLLTFFGFVDLATLDILESHSPNTLYRPGLNAMLQHFNLFPERGPIPETGGILPEYPNANVLERIRKAKEAHAARRKKIQEIKSQTQTNRKKSGVDTGRSRAWSSVG